MEHAGEPQPIPIFMVSGLFLLLDTVTTHRTAGAAFALPMFIFHRYAAPSAAEKLVARKRLDGE